MTRATRLLIVSFNNETEDLQAFIAAWSAFEIFVNATFKATYDERFSNLMEDGSPDAAKRVFLRFKTVMKGKYRLADKFLIIASVLNSGGAVDDVETFQRLKKVRDVLLHALEEMPSSLPTVSVQTLLLKYVRLHLDAHK